MKKYYILPTIILTIIAVLLIWHNTDKPTEVKHQPVRVQTQAQVKTIPLPVATDVEADINQFRTSQGLPVFNSDVASLDQAAQVRADGMCTDNNWSHDGDWAVLDQYYSYSYAGENLYYGSLRDNQAAGALKDWIASPEHLKNLVGNYTQIGVAVKSCPGFQNEPTAVIVTNYFGVPR